MRNLSYLGDDYTLRFDHAKTDEELLFITRKIILECFETINPLDIEAQHGYHYFRKPA